MKLRISDDFAEELHRRLWVSDEGLDGLDVLNVMRDLLDDWFAWLATKMMNPL